MKILLVDNHTNYLHKVKNALSSHDVEVQVYEPGLNFNYYDKDVVILSGGGGVGYELYDRRGSKLWHEDEMQFALSCPKPLVGICMGFEVISAAYGAKVQPLGKLVQGFHKQQVVQPGQKVFGKKELVQYEHHRFAVADVPKEEFEVLAVSEIGVEMIKHKNKPLIASQFHPEEKGGTLSLDRLISQVL